MAHYPTRWSPDYQLPKQAANTRVDDKQYLSLATVNKPRLDQILAWMQANQPGRYQAIHQDPFIRLCIDQLDADILLPRKPPEKRQA